MIAVFGPESSGSRLVAKIVAHVTNICEYGSWDGFGKRGNVYHKTFPAYLGKKRRFVDINFPVDKIIIATRDENCIVLSKLKRKFSNSVEQALEENNQCKLILEQYLDRAFVFSYETFLFYRLGYLKLLYKYLGVESDFIPDDIYDANAAYLA